MFKQSSLGQSSLQELLVPSPGSPRTLVGSPNGQNDAEHPSPILRWTSDGSMMEELMKALGTNPSTPTFGGGGGSLFKDGSITSSLQAAKEAAAAEQEAAEENGKEQEQPEELQPTSGSGGASSVASQPFSFEALSGVAAQDRPLNSPNLGPLQGRGSSSSMAPSGSSSTLSMPTFSTGLQIPDHGLVFSGLPGPQQVFPQNLCGGSLMPGSSRGLRMGTALRAPHSMSMLMSSGPIVSASGGAMMNLPPLSGQMSADAWMGPGGSIPALRPGSTLTPEVPLAVNTTRLQASDGTVSIMPGISVWSPWAQQQQQQMPPPQPLGQEQGDHDLQQQLLQQARLLEQVASSPSALQQGFNSLRSRSVEGPTASQQQHHQPSSPRSRSFDEAGGRPGQPLGNTGLSHGGHQGSRHSGFDMAGAGHSLAGILGPEQGRADSAPPTPTWAHQQADFGPFGQPAGPHMGPHQQQQQLDLLGSRSAPGSPAGGLHHQGTFGPVPGLHQQPLHHQQQHQVGSLGGSRSAPGSPMEGIVQAQAASLQQQQPSRFFLEQAGSRRQQHVPARAPPGGQARDGHQQVPFDHHFDQTSSMPMYHHQGSMLPLEVQRQTQLPGSLMVPPMLPAQVGDALYTPPSNQLQEGSLVFASPAPGQPAQQYQVVYASTGPGQPPTPVLQPVPGSQAPVAAQQLSPQQVTAVQAQLAWEDAGLSAAPASRDLKPQSLLQMALQAQLALKDAEVAAAAAQLDASGAGPAFTPIPVGLTRLSAPPSGSGDTGSQRAGDSGAPMSTTPMASQEGSPQRPFAGGGSGRGHWAGAKGRDRPSAPEGSLTAKVLATAREAQANQQGLQMPHIPTLEPGAKENHGQADLGCVSRPRHKRERSIRSSVPSVAPKRHSHGSGSGSLLEPVGSGASEGGEGCQMGTASRSHSNPGDPAMLADMVDDQGQPLNAAAWKALTRKEKNRQSAAASRARREAYTESLEAKVKKLHEQQDWLKAQYEKQQHLPDSIVRDPNAPIRPPVRHVSF